MKIFRSRSPLRISFAGGGTDVPPYPLLFGGAVVSTTIDRYSYVTIKKNEQKGIRIISQDYDILEKLNSVSNFKISGKTAMIKAALIQAGIKNENIDLIIHSDSAPGSGLGSSSALAVSLVGCISKYLKRDYSKTCYAKLATTLERELVGIPGGLQDQYASTFGGMNFIEFGKNVSITPLNLKKHIMNELLSSLIIINTGKTRLSGNILNKQISKYEKQHSSTLKHLKIIKNLAYDVRDFLKNGEIYKLGKTMNVYWEHKKQLESTITNLQIDSLYKKIMNAGALGGKILGAGGGGHMMFLCEPDKKHNIIKTINKINVEIIKFNFDSSGLQMWTVQNGRVKDE